MITRARYIIFAIVAAIAGCSSATSPLACEGNPKCKADAQPKPPSQLQPLQVSPAPASTVNR